MSLISECDGADVKEDAARFPDIFGLGPPSERAKNEQEVKEPKGMRAIPYGDFTRYCTTIVHRPLPPSVEMVCAPDPVYARLKRQDEERLAKQVMTSGRAMPDMPMILAKLIVEGCEAREREPSVTTYEK